MKPITCPYCNKEQLDVNNGNDPNIWWNMEDGEEIDYECIDCERRFKIKAYRELNFYIEEYDDE